MSQIVSLNKMTISEKCSYFQCQLWLKHGPRCRIPASIHSHDEWHLLLKDIDRTLQLSPFITGLRFTEADMLVFSSFSTYLDHNLFNGAVILGPMVRVSTHPLRILALKYGADLVYTEEIIDYKLINARIRENSPDNCVIFRTSEEEKGRLFLQLGTSDPEKALQAAKVVENYVVGVDVNMGCPKDYSIKGGMGAALLKDPNKIKSILTTLVENLNILVTAKIRCLPSLEDTITLAKMIESCGVSALIVHGRTKSERPSDSCRIHYIKAITEAISIPVIANGGSKEHIRLHDDITWFKQLTKASGVMLSRAAMWNPAIFSSNPKETTQLEVAKEYLKLCITYDHHEAGTKYCLLRMLMNHTLDPFYTDLTEAPSLLEICRLLDLENEYIKELERRKNLSRKRDFSIESHENVTLDNKQPKYDFVKIFTENLHLESNKIIIGNVEFSRNTIKSNVDLPKQRLLVIARNERIKEPVYKSFEDHCARTFYGACMFDGFLYINEIGNRQKRGAEQSAAQLCLNQLEK